MLKRIVTCVLCLILSGALVVGAAPKKISYTKEDVRLLAKVIQLEAINNERAQIAVGNVVVNRVRSKGFPNTIYKVIHQKGQFSVLRLKKWKTLKPSRQAMTSAKKALEGKEVVDKRVLYFKYKKLKKKWGRHVYVTTIGDNMFYR